MNEILKSTANNENTITSLEVAEMVGKEHSKLLKDIRRYSEQLAEAKIGLGDFMEIETYRVLPEENGNGTFFFTNCGNRMFSIRDKMAYHGKLCPACLYRGKQVTLYIRGSKEANEYWDKKLNKI